MLFVGKSHIPLPVFRFLITLLMFEFKLVFRHTSVKQAAPWRWQLLRAGSVASSDQIRTTPDTLNILIGVGVWKPK